MQCMYCIVSNPHISSRRGQVMKRSSLTSDRTGIPQVIVTDWDPNPLMDGWPMYFFRKLQKNVTWTWQIWVPDLWKGDQLSRQSLVSARVWKSSDGKRLLYTGNDGRWYFGGWGLVGKQLTWWVQTMSLWVQFFQSKMWVSISGGVHVPNQWGCLPWGCVFCTFLYHLWAILMVSTLNLGAFMCNFWDKLMDKKH